MKLTLLCKCLLLLTVIATVTLADAQQPGADPADKYAWLENVSGERAVNWVKDEDTRTAKVLRADPDFEPFQAEALHILDDKSRLAWPRLRGGKVYNFWQDANNPRGILRVTTASDYVTSSPHWRTLLDIDELNKTEGASWVYRQLIVEQPEDRYALVELSTLR